MKIMEQDFGTEPTGNTNTVGSWIKPKEYASQLQKLEAEQKYKGKKYRNWYMTIFNDTERDKVKKMNYKYLLMGEEICPTTGKKHYQTFIIFKSPVTFDSLKKKIPTTHFGKCDGTAKENVVYCKKDMNIHFEDGTPPYQRLSCEDLKKMSYEDIIEYDARCHQAYIKAKNILDNNIKIDELFKDIKVYYIQGPSGSGKTKRAIELVRYLKEDYGDEINMIKYENSFYIGVGTAKIAIYDDFRDSHMKASEFINLIDYNIHHMNIKGGERPNKYKLIIITSVQKLKDIYSNMTDEPRKQWERRIQLIDFYLL